MTLKDNKDGTFSIVAPCSFEKLKPLSDDEIVKLWFKCGDDEYTVRRFARAIEERHGIK